MNKQYLEYKQKAVEHGLLPDEQPIDIKAICNLPDVDFETYCYKLKLENKQHIIDAISRVRLPEQVSFNTSHTMAVKYLTRGLYDHTRLLSCLQSIQPHTLQFDANIYNALPDSFKPLYSQLTYNREPAEIPQNFERIQRGKITIKKSQNIVVMINETNSYLFYNGIIACFEYIQQGDADTCSVYVDRLTITLNPIYEKGQVIQIFKSLFPKNARFYIWRNVPCQP